MIKANEFRLGNLLLQKVQNKISSVPCTAAHFQLVAQNAAHDLYPVLLKAELLEQYGFLENKAYPLLPDAHEFVLQLPVQGAQQNEVVAYIKNNKECFARATVNGAPASNNIYHLHQLQNLYFSLTGEELCAKK